MKKSYLVIAGILVLVLVVVFSYSGTYNKAVGLQETLDQSWNDVGAAYQRRADLVPQLVATVKGAAENEKGILTELTQARAGNRQCKNPRGHGTAAIGKKINTAINLAFEAYPQIRSTENFGALQAQLEGTENRINKSRKDYNATVKIYNIYIRGFFTSMILNEEEFPKKEGFQANKGAENAPEVNFD